MLTACATGVGVLLLLAALAVPIGRHPRTAPWTGAAIHGGCLTVSAGFAVLAVSVLLADAPGAMLALPLGPPWSAAGGGLALDGLSAWFLLLLGLTGAGTSLFAWAQPPGPPRTLVAWPLFLAGMALTLAAADAFLLLLGFEAMSLAGWALVAADHRQEGTRAAARLFLAFAVLAAACLVPAFGLLARGNDAGAADLSFAAIRAAPPEGWRAAAVLALGLLGAGAKAGLVPLHAWLPLAHPAAPSHASALLSGAMVSVALYVMARLLFDLCGPAQPSWWGLPLLALGAAGAVLGALRANLEGDIKAVLACSTIENVGLVVAGFGLALAFRGADLGALAALAAAAALFHALAHGVFKTLLFLAAGAVARAAGSRRIDALGGLVHAMPRTAACALAGALAAASLPPLPGFAGEWLLLQALLAGWRVGEIGFQVTVAAALALVAMAAALAAAAMLRLWGLVFLGRPRTPRGAGAGEVPRRMLWALLLPAGLTVLLGLFAAPVLRLAGPALRVLVGPAATVPVHGLVLAAGEGGSAYAPLAVAALLGLAAGAAVLLVRWRSPGRIVAEAARGPVWNGGFIDPPAHLPFGDPLTQPSATGLAQPLRRMLGAPLLLARESVETPDPGDPRPGRHAAGFTDPSLVLLLRPAARARDALAGRIGRLQDLTIRQCLSLGFATLVLLLALLAWLEAA